MPETVRIALDVLILLGAIYAIVRGVFKANSDVTMLKAQIITNTAWIKGHEEWSRHQTEEMQAIREDIAYIRGQMEHAERKKTLNHERD